MSATIVFDLDGTLVETLPDLTAATNAVITARGLKPVDTTFLRRAVGHGAKAMLQDALAHRQHEVDASAMAAMHREFLDHYSAHIAEESHAFPGLEPALDALDARGYRLAVCTNKYEDLARRLLTALGLAARFNPIVGPDTLGVSKPDPEHLLGAIRLAGGTPDRAIMVGDSPADIDAANAANVPSIAVTFGYTNVAPADLGATRLIDHFSALPDAVESLLNG